MLKEYTRASKFANAMYTFSYLRLLVFGLSSDVTVVIKEYIFDIIALFQQYPCVPQRIDHD